MRLPGPLVDADWLAANITSVEIADVRWSIPTGPKFDSFDEGHLPGAVFVDLDADLSDPPGPRGRHPLPPVDRFRRTISALGLGRRPTICYDDSSGATAARLWWMLDAIGHPVAVLDGGLATWTGPIEAGTGTFFERPTSDPATIGDPSVDDWPRQRVIEVEEISEHVGGGSALLDARSAERFRGEPNPVDPVAGHIPGGRSRPWTDNIDEGGIFRTPDQLRRELTALGLDGRREWLASCGSGVTACHNLLAARIAGLGDGRLYAGSWSEWISDPSRPVEVGAAPAVTPPDNGGVA
ncbi:MAG: sulfurtransferase [Acidimicrobiia bacterium]|nr:sulfurtransferase [Acidimicrobiia bacterium]